MRSQAGNALWVILIAIAMLTMLTAMWSRSSSQTDDTGAVERDSIRISQILQYASSLEAAVQTLLMRGCSENELSFDYDVNAITGYENPNSPPDRSCHVFYPEGAGMAYRDIGELFDVQGSMTIGTASVGRTIRGVGENNKTDLYLSVFTSNAKGERMALCKSINRKAGILPTGTAPAGGFDPFTSLILDIARGQKFTGTFASPVVGSFAMAWRGDANYFCWGHNTTPAIGFAYVLLAR